MIFGCIKGLRCDKLWYHLEEKDKVSCRNHLAATYLIVCQKRGTNIRNIVNRLESLARGYLYVLN